MKAPTFDELVLLPEPLALQRHFDAGNYRVFRWLLIVVVMLSLAGIAAAADEGHTVGPILYTANVLFCAVLFVLRDREVFARNFRQILLVFLFVQILVLKFTTVYMRGDDALAPFIMVALLLLAFRLRLAEHFMLYTTFWGAAVFPLAWVGVARPAAEAPDTGSAIALSINAVIWLAVSVGLTQLNRRRFLSVWRRERAVHENPYPR